MVTETSKIPKNSIRIPAYVDPIKLADEIKRGITEKFLRDAAKIRKAKSHLAKQFQ